MVNKILMVTNKIDRISFFKLDLVKHEYTYYYISWLNFHIKKLSSKIQKKKKKEYSPCYGNSACTFSHGHNTSWRWNKHNKFFIYLFMKICHTKFWMNIISKKYRYKINKYFIIFIDTKRNQRHLLSQATNIGHHVFCHCLLNFPLSREMHAWGLG